MNFKEIYTSSHKINFEKKYPLAYQSGHWFAPTLPKYKTANGLSTYCCNVFNWNGHHLERTNNIGRPIKRKIEKFNILTSKVELLDNGIEWQKGTGTKGTSDLKGHFVSKKHRFPIPVYIEIKIKKDRMSDDQKKYEETINKSGAIYKVVKSPEDLIEFYNNLQSI